MKTIAVYGSLKKDRYNHGLLEEEKYLGNTTVRGTLYRISSYPALISEGDNEYDAELYQVSDDVYQAVKSMELGAGYKEVEVDGAIVYYADTTLRNFCVENCKEIESY